MIIICNGLLVTVGPIDVSLSFIIHVAAVKPPFCSVNRAETW